MQLLLTLNEGVRALGSRFDTHQNYVEDKFTKMNAELTLLKNRVDLLETSFRHKQEKQEPTMDSFEQRLGSERWQRDFTYK